MNDWVREGYEKHRRQLFRVAWLVLRRADLAEDAVQTAFSRILRRPPQLNGSAKAYLLKAVRNAAIDLHRRRLHGCAGTSTDWEDIAGTDRRDNRSAGQVDAVYEALRRLNPAIQEIVHLHINEQMTFREISELLELPLQTVASRYRRALQQIRARVSNDGRSD